MEKKMESQSLFLFAMVAALFVGGMSCSQYEYASPTPGILEVRLRVKNTRTELIPFALTNAYSITLIELEATKPQGVHMRILADLNAIRRYSLGDRFNCLAPAARDSEYVLGITYAPPAVFTGIKLNINTDSFVSLTNGFITNFIPVTQTFPPPPSLQQLPDAQREANITVHESRRTLVTVTMDLDSTLARRTDVFEYHPYFYISSIQNF